jgi:hypothetical protein
MIVTGAVAQAASVQKFYESEKSIGVEIYS